MSDQEKTEQELANARHEKMHDEMGGACQFLREENPGFHFVIVGMKTADDGKTSKIEISSDFCGHHTVDLLKDAVGLLEADPTLNDHSHSDGGQGPLQ